MDMYSFEITTSNEEESEESLFSNEEIESENSQFYNENMNPFLNQILNKKNYSEESLFLEEENDSEESLSLNEEEESEESQVLNEVVSSDENKFPNEDDSILIQHSKRQFLTTEKKLVQNPSPNKVKSRKRQLRTKVRSKKGRSQTKEVKLKSRQFQNKEEQRLYHNQLEKRRRKDLRKKYDEVRDCLPCFRNVDKSKVSRELIVIKAADYINRLPKLEDVKLEVEKYAEELEVFKRKFAELEEAERNGDTEAIERLKKFEPPTMPSFADCFGLSDDPDEEAPLAPKGKKRKSI